MLKDDSKVQTVILKGEGGRGKADRERKVNSSLFSSISELVRRIARRFE
jgi:hypothetical protein